jgi:hypothetical protein
VGPPESKRLVPELGFHVEWPFRIPQRDRVAHQVAAIVKPVASPWSPDETFLSFVVNFFLTTKDTKAAQRSCAKVNTAANVVIVSPGLSRRMRKSGYSIMVCCVRFVLRTQASFRALPGWGLLVRVLISVAGSRLPER